MPLPPLVRQVVDKKLTKYCAAKIPPEYRDQIRVHYKVRGNSVTLFESRPYWDDPSEWSNLAVAQFRYEPKDNTWTLYCADRNHRWHLYIDAESSRNLDDLLKEVDRDPTGIFWG
jgi:hypothetical protein